MTTQAAETIIVDGREGYMDCYPQIPEGHPRIRYLGEPAIQSSACWRGYVATWAIEGSRLFLNAIKGCCELAGDTPVAAEWFSGELEIVVPVPTENPSQTLDLHWETIETLHIRQGEVARWAKGPNKRCVIEDALGEQLEKVPHGRLVYALLRARLVTRQQFFECARERVEGLSILEQMLEKAYFGEMDLVNLLHQSAGFPKASLEGLTPETSVVHEITAAQARRYKAIPVSQQGNQSTLAMFDPLDVATLSELRESVASPWLDIAPATAPLSEILRAIDSVYGAA